MMYTVRKSATPMASMTTKEPTMLTNRNGRRKLRLAGGAGACLLLAAMAATAAAQAGRPDDAEAVRTKLLGADGLLARGLPDLAAREYQAVLAMKPTGEQATIARYRLAVCHFQLGRNKEAVPLLEAALADPKLPQRDEALAVLGHCRLSLKDHDKALAALEELLGKYPASPQAEVAALNRAQVLHMMGRHGEAAAAAGEFVKKYPASARRTSAQFTLALALSAQGKHAPAAAALADVLKTPNCPFALEATLLLGQCQEALGKLDDAAAQYAKAAAIAPPDRQVEALYSLGMVQYRAGKNADAVRSLSSALAAEARRDPKGASPSPCAAPARFELALAQLADGKLDDARKTLSLVAKSDAARAAKARYWLAQCDIREGKHEAAYAALDALAGSKPPPDNLPDVLYDRALCAMALDRHDVAAEQFAAFRKACPSSPRQADAAYRQAFCLHKLGKLAECLPLCAAAAGDKTIGRAAGELAAESLFLLARYDEAEKAFADLSRTADDAQKRRLVFRLVQCAFLQGHYARAMELGGPLAADKAVAADWNLRQVIFLLGDAQLQTGDYKSAAATLARYVPLAGADKAEAQCKLGLALLRAGDRAGADKAFTEVGKAWTKGPKPSAWVVRATFEHGLIAFEDKQAKRAAAALEQVLTAGPPEDLAAHSLYMLAWLDFDAAQFAKAAARFAEVVKRYPRHARAADAAYRQGAALAEAGKHAEAQQAFEAYLKAYPADRGARAARREIARCLAAQGKNAEAAKALGGLAAEKNAASDEVLYELAWAQRQSKDTAAAVATYQRLLKDYPAGKLATAARAELADLLCQTDKYEDAAALLKAVLADKSADANTAASSHYRLGWCYEKLGRTADAASTFAAYAAAHGDGEFAPSALYYAGADCAKLGRLEEAEKHFAALLAKFPAHDLAAVAMLKQGEVQSQLQEYGKAIATYAAFLKKHPNDKFAFLAQFGTGWALENTKKYADARAWYEKVTASQKGPTAARAQFQIGETYFAEGKYDKAAAELLKVDIVYAYPDWSARALYEAGRAFEALGQHGQARSQYSACAAKYKDNPVAQQAAKRLKELPEK